MTSLITRITLPKPLILGRRTRAKPWSVQPWPIQAPTTPPSPPPEKKKHGICRQLSAASAPCTKDGNCSKRQKTGNNTQDQACKNMENRRKRRKPTKNTAKDKIEPLETKHAMSCHPVLPWLHVPQRPLRQPSPDAPTSSKAQQISTLAPASCPPPTHGRLLR